MFELPDLSRGLKYYNLFSFLYLKYFKAQGATSLELKDVYNYTVQKAEDNGESGTWWDVFDGTMWICTFVAAQIAIGYIQSVI
jgi:hypothetical protein